MPKITKHSRSPLQERLLSTLMLLDLLVGEGSWFTEKAISKMMGGRWTNYRAQEMINLHKAGWAEYDVIVNNPMYRLSETGKRSLEIDYAVDPNEYVTGDEYQFTYLGEGE